MTVPFSHIPSNLRVPLFFAEIDASQANTAAAAQRTLLIGQMSAAATATAAQPVQMMSIAAAKQLAGVGSILANMAWAYRQNDPTGEVWLLPVADAGGATAATGTIAFAGTATAAGTLALYVAGQLIPLAIASGTTAAQAATAVAAAINAAVDLPVTASVTTVTVTLTAKNAGLVANDVDVRFNYLGSAAGEVLPAGLVPTVTPMSGGATNPALATGLANLADMAFDFIVCAQTDATATAAIAAFLNDSTGRWSWTQQVFGHAFYALRGSSGTLASYGAALNNQHASVIGFNDSPSPAWSWAAALAGSAALSLRGDPGLPLQTLQIAGVLAPPIGSRFSLTTRNTLLYDGISTFTVNADSSVAIENLITTYVTNPQGQPDNSYLQIETMFTAMYVLRAMRNMVSAKYGRKKLAADGTRLLPGSNVVTPSTVRADIIATYEVLEGQGMVQRADLFAANLVVQQNAQNPNRLDVLYPAVLIDQLRTFALLFQFRLS